ncbi:13354_t:CDS:1, partial [Rhizophagus irregularis]
VLKFMALSTDRIKSHVWNVRFQAWKQWKRQHNITKVLLNGILRTAPIVALAREALETLIV